MAQAWGNRLGPIQHGKVTARVFPQRVISLSGNRAPSARHPIPTRARNARRRGRHPIPRPRVSSAKIPEVRSARRTSTFANMRAARMAAAAGNRPHGAVDRRHWSGWPRLCACGIWPVVTASAPLDWHRCFSTPPKIPFASARGGVERPGYMVQRCCRRYICRFIATT